MPETIEGQPDIQHSKYSSYESSKSQMLKTHVFCRHGMAIELAFILFKN